MAILYDLESARRVDLDCADDRGLRHGTEVTQNIKTPAGAYGLAQDLHVARLVGNPTEYDRHVRPLGETAKIIAIGLGRSSIVASIHEVCAAEQGVIRVARTITERPQETHRIAQEIHGGEITVNEYMLVANAYEHMLFRGNTKAFRGARHESECMDTEDQYPAIVRKRLAHARHIATTLQVNHRINTWFDAAGAYQAGQASYHADQWAIPGIAEKVDEILPHDNIELFTVASSIRVAATSLNLPYGGDESRLGLDINTIAA